MHKTDIFSTISARVGRQHRTGRLSAIQQLWKGHQETLCFDWVHSSVQQCLSPFSPVNDVVKVAVLHRRDDLLEEPLRLLRRGPPLRHDVVKQLPVRRVLLQKKTASKQELSATESTRLAAHHVCVRETHPWKDSKTHRRMYIKRTYKYT